ncbi:MAG: hypothetical protein P8Y93_10005 [Acidobacteriota bacterium]
MNRRVLWVALCALALAVPSFAQYSVTNQGISNITGTGARALGMGGAFIAIADDATAASWNPAGLAQLTRPEVSLVYEYLDGTYDFASDLTTGYVFNEGDPWQFVTSVTAPASISDDGISFGSVTYPFQMLNRNFTAQVSYRRMASFPDMDRQAQETFQWFIGDDEVYSFETINSLDDRFGGGFDAYTLSLAAEVVKSFRVGLSFNYVDAAITDNATAVRNDSDLSTDLSFNYSGSYDFSDWQIDVGIQWDIGSHFTFGAVYHDGFTADISFQDSFVYSFNEADWGWFTSYEPGTEYATTTNSQVTWPDGWGVGLAWRPTDRITFSADYDETSWSESMVSSINVWVDADPPELVTVTDVPFPYFVNTQNDTETVRVGGEYLFMFSSGVLLPVRAGWFKEKQLAVPSEMYESATSPREGPDYSGYSLGVGLVVKNFQFDVAWVHTDGDMSQLVDDVPQQNEDVTVTVSGPESVELKTDRFLASLIVRF